MDPSRGLASAGPSADDSPPERAHEPAGPSRTPDGGSPAETATTTGGEHETRTTTPRGVATPRDDDDDDADRREALPRWAWLPRDGEVFAVADPLACAPYDSPPAEDASRRAPGRAETLHLAEEDDDDDGDDDDDAHRASWWSLGEGGGDVGGPARDFPPSIRDSTTTAFEARLEADWRGNVVVDEWRARREASGGQRAAGGGGESASSFTFTSAVVATPSTSGSVQSGVGGAIPSLTPVVGGGGVAATPSNERATRGADAASAPAYGSLGLASIFTGKYLQARRKPPHRVQFFSDSRGVHERWNLLGGVRLKRGEWRGWGVMRFGQGGGGDSARATRDAFASAFGEDAARNLDRLGGRDFIVVRSRQTPRRCLLVVRLTLPSGEAVVSTTPGKLRSRSRLSRAGPDGGDDGGGDGVGGGDDDEARSYGAPERIASISSRGDAFATAGWAPERDEGDEIMTLSERLLRTFALKPERKRKHFASKSALAAWRAATASAADARRNADRMAVTRATRTTRWILREWSREAVLGAVARERLARAEALARDRSRTWRTRSCFKKWRRDARASIASEVLERRADIFLRRRITHKRLRDVVRFWHITATASLRARDAESSSVIYRANALRRMWARRSRASLRESLRTWRECASVVADARERARAASERAERHEARTAFRKKAAAFRAWRRGAEMSAAEEEKTSIAARWRAARAARTSWRRWRDVVAATRREDCVLRRARGLCASRCVRAWRDVADGKRAARATLRRAERLMRRSLTALARRAFVAWLDHHRHASSSRRFVLLSIVRRGYDTKRRCFAGWREYARWVAALDAMSGFVRLASRAMRAWSTFVTLRAKGRAVEARVDALGKRRMRGRAFMAWMLECQRRLNRPHALAARLAVAERRAEGTREKHLARARRFAFQAWTRALEDAKRHERELAETIKRVEDARIARERAFAIANVWAERLSRRVRRRWKSQLFASWRTRAERSKARDARAETLTRRLSARALGRVVRAWAAVVGDVKERALRESLCAWSSKFRDASAATRAFHRWRAETREALAARAAVAREEEISRVRAVDAARIREEEEETARRRVAEEARAEARAAARFHRATRSFARLTFAAWRDVVVSRRRRARAVARFDARRRARALAGAYDAWAETCARERRVRVSCARLRGRATRRVVGGAFSRWTEAIREAKASAVALERAERRNAHLQHRVASAACAAWRAVVAGEKRARAKTRAFEIKAATRRLRGAFARWADVVCDRNARAVALKRAERRNAHVARRLSSLAFLEWRARAVYDARLGGVARKFIARWSARAASRAFRRWTEAAGRARRARVAIARCARRALAAGFNTWRERVSEERTRRRVVETFTRRTRRARASRAFAEWIAVVYDAKLGRVAAARADRSFARRTRRALADAHASWRSVAAEARRARETALATTRRRVDDDVAEEKRRDVAIEKLTTRVRFVRTSAAFAEWTAVVDAAARDRAAVARADRLAERRARRVARAAFTVWRDAAERAISRRRAIERSTRLARRATAHRAFIAWSGVVDRERLRASLEADAARALEAMSGDNDGAMAAMERAVGEAAAATEKAAREDAAARERSLREDAAEEKQAALDAAAAEAAAAADAASARRLRAAIGRAERLFYRAASGLLSAAFASWRDVVDEETRRERLTRRATTRFARQLLARACAGWRSSVLDANRARASLARADGAFRRTRDRAFAVAFARWRDATSEGHWQTTLARVTSRRRRAPLARAFARWRLAGEEARRAAAANAKATRALGRLRHRAASVAFRAWNDDARGRERARRALKTFALKWENSRARRAFRSWTERVAATTHDAAAAARADRHFARAAARAARATTAAVFDEWRDVASSARDANDAARRVAVAEARADRSRARVVARVAAASLSTWHRNARGRRRVRKALSRFVLRWQHARLASAFAAWTGSLDDEKTRRGVDARAARKMARVKTSAAFARWAAFHDASVASRLARIRADRARSRVANRLAWSALLAWSERARERRRRRVGVERLAARRARASVANAFWRWIKRVDESIRHRNGARRIVNRINRATLHGVFWRWKTAKDVERRARVAETRADAAFQRRVRNARWRAFRTWRDACEGERRARVVVQKKTSRWRRARVSRVFERWASIARDAKRARKIAGVIRRRRDARETRAATREWRALAARSKRDAILERVSTRFETRLTTRRVAALMRAWSDAAARRKRLRVGILALVTRRKTTRVDDNFSEWKTLARERTLERVALTRARRRARRVASRSAFIRWAARAKDVAAAREVIAAALKKAASSAAIRSEVRKAGLSRASKAWDARTIARVFAAWIEVRDGAAYVRGVTARLRASVTREDTRRRLKRWASAMYARRAKVGKMRRAAARWRRKEKTAVERALFVWKTHVVRGQKSAHDRVDAEVEWLNASLASERAQKSGIAEELRSLRREASGLNSLVDTLRRETAILQKTLTERDANVAKLLDERKATKAEVKRIIEERKAAKATIEETKQSHEAAALRRVLVDKNAKIAHLLSQRRALHETHAASEARASELEKVALEATAFASEASEAKAAAEKRLASELARAHEERQKMALELAAAATPIRGTHGTYTSPVYESEYRDRSPPRSPPRLLAFASSSRREVASQYAVEDDARAAAISMLSPPSSPPRRDAHTQSPPPSPPRVRSDAHTQSPPPSPPRSFAYVRARDKLLNSPTRRRRRSISMDATTETETEAREDEPRREEVEVEPERDSPIQRVAAEAVEDNDVVDVDGDDGGGGGEESTPAIPQSSLDDPVEEAPADAAFPIATDADDDADDDARRHAAATRIQSVHRGGRARSMVRATRLIFDAAATRVQAAARGWASRKTTAAARARARATAKEAKSPSRRVTFEAPEESEPSDEEELAASAARTPDPPASSSKAASSSRRRLSLTPEAHAAAAAAAAAALDFDIEYDVDEFNPHPYDPEPERDAEPERRRAKLDASFDAEDDAAAWAASVSARASPFEYDDAGMDAGDVGVTLYARRRGGVGGDDDDDGVVSIGDEKFAFDAILEGVGDARAVCVVANPVASAARSGFDSTVIVLNASGGDRFREIPETDDDGTFYESSIGDAVADAIADRLVRVATGPPAIPPGAEGTWVGTTLGLSMFHAHGLAVDDLLAGAVGNDDDEDEDDDEASAKRIVGGGAAAEAPPTRLRVRPRRDVAASGNGRSAQLYSSAGSGGLLYEVEDAAVLALRDLAATKAALRRGRLARFAAAAAAAAGRVVESHSRESHSIEGEPAAAAAATARVTELVFTTESVVVDRGATATHAALGARTTTTSRAATCRVVEIMCPNVSDVAHLAACVAKLVDRADEPELRRTSPEWRSSALTKLVKGPLTGEGRLAFVVDYDCRLEARAAAGGAAALRLASAARLLPGRADASSSHASRRVRRVVRHEREPGSRREALKKKLAKVKRDAAAAFAASERNGRGDGGGASLVETETAARGRRREREAASTPAPTSLGRSTGGWSSARKTSPPTSRRGAAVARASSRRASVASPSTRESIDDGEYGRAGIS